MTALLFAAATAPIVVVPLTSDPLPGPGAEAWIGSGTVVLALTCAGLLARGRIRHARLAPSRLLRIFAAAALFAGSLTLWLIADELWRRGGSGQLTPMATLALAAFLAVALVLFGIADFWLGWLRPRRSGRWFAASVLLFALLIGACVMVASLAEDAPATIFYHDLATMVGLAAAAGIAWWSYLPAPDADLASRFE